MSTNEKTTISSGTAIDESLLTNSIMETAESMPEISQFVAAIRDAGLTGSLGSPDLKTLFAPTNEAVSGISGKQLVNAVARQIAIGRQTEADLRTTSEVRTLAGPVKVEYQDDGARFGGARIVRRDIACVNGHIHLVDGLART
jgi:uncharacterized surface protein with fasciclin (FAS1) repeats